MRALVTGGTGFIGKHLCERLDETGWEVYITDRSQEPIVSLKCNPDVVFHLASLFLSGHTENQVEDLIVSNILFGTKVLEAMRFHGVRNIVNVGTSWQHYKNNGYDPVNLYAATKQAFQDVLTYYVNAGYMSAVTLKLFDTYGPEDTRAKLVPYLLNTNNAILTLGEQKISLVYIDDVVDALVIAAHRLMDGITDHESYAVSADESISIRNLVAAITELKHLSVEFTHPYREREVMEPWSGPRLPLWYPKTSLREGLLKCTT